MSAWLPVLATLVTVVLLVAVLVGLKVLSRRFTAVEGPVPMRLLSRLPMAPRQALLVVEVGEQFFLLAQGEAQTRFVAELDPALRDALPGPGSEDAGPTFLDRVRAQLDRGVPATARRV